MILKVPKNGTFKYPAFGGWDINWWEFEMNARRPKTVRRQEKLEEIYEIYKNLSLDEQISEAVSTAYQIGTLTIGNSAPL